MSKTKKLVLSALLLSLTIVFSRFLSFKTNILVVSFTFVPIMISAIYLGPKYSSVIAALADLIGALLFPFGTGTYFPGFTLSAFLTGLVYGLFLHKKGYTESDENNDEVIREIDSGFISKLIISSIIVLGLIDILLSSVWLNMTVGKSYTAILSVRTILKLIMLPIQVVVIFLLEKVLTPLFKKYLED